MADTQASAAGADASMTEAPATASENTNGVHKDTNGDELAHTNGDARLTKDDVENAEPQATTNINAPDGAGTAQVDVVAAAADSTPGSNKNKRKSSAGVPEHKTKKLNKKKSMVTLHLDLQAGDYVFARLKGYPSWPSIICDEAMLPESLLGNRPVSTKRPDGTYRDDFLEGGKNAKDRTYPVMFLSTNEFAWVINSALAPLTVEDCTVPSDKKMQPALKDAYSIAAEQHDLDYYKDLLRKHEQELQEQEQAAREEADRKAAEKAEKEERKAEKERRKSKTAEDGAAGDGEKSSKKRKKEVESEGEGPKPKKTPKVKLTAKEAKPESAKKSKPKKKAPKGENEPELPEGERLNRRERSIFYLRHRLQKCFLSADTPPKDEDMPAMAEHFSQLEQYKDLEPQLIRKTKIHKVLKNIIRLESVPKDDEHHFKSRSQDMLNHWNTALNASADGDTSMLDAPAPTNGETKTEEAEPKADVKEAGDSVVEATDLGNNAGDEATEPSTVVSGVIESKTDGPDAAEDTKPGAENVEEAAQVEA